MSKLISGSSLFVEVRGTGLKIYQNRTELKAYYIIINQQFLIHIQLKPALVSVNTITLSIIDVAPSDSIILEMLAAKSIENTVRICDAVKF
jgi:hypothetical protein